MAIDRSDVRRVAKLAGLRIEDAALEDTARELEGIMNWIEQLDAVDVEGVEPMTSAVDGLVLPMREDVVTEGGDAERVLANAPVRAGNYFVVPKVID